MAVIEVMDLKKEYRIAKKQDGISGTIKHLIHPVYGKKEAVKGISFAIQEGESVAFLGANGAGKSTTIKMLTGIMKPSDGKIAVMGRDPFEKRMENAKDIGVVFGQKTQLWWDIPVIETFCLLKSIYEIPEEKYEKNMREFGEILELDGFLHQPARKLSLGQRVRADLAASLLHEPPVLFLDEPTIGLDVAVKQKIYTFLRKINKEKKTTILLTSHDLNDLESLCQRLIILENGEILFDDQMDKIFEQYEEGTTLEQIVIGLFDRRRMG
ncbi:MAG: ATP-binding cassette domain-containing protein [Clostridia bacterium]|nr:ATP-binding cassette domain-containing protein [Clostridia bacterium]NCC42984.1 ATP-binding cassette domain-containing protein [Clostridia bacterium]